jgi:hypothetical protein
LLLTAFGSSWYHLDPNNATLVWDRLPMTITFMSMVAAVIMERISLRLGLWLLPILLIVGTGKRVCNGIGARCEAREILRFYAAVQAYSVLVVLLALSVSTRATRKAAILGLVVGFYGLAKALEYLR